jgi:hypothetical protein
VRLGAKPRARSPAPATRQNSPWIFFHAPPDCVARLSARMRIMAERLVVAAGIGLDKDLEMNAGKQMIAVGGVVV